MGFQIPTPTNNTNQIGHFAQLVVGAGNNVAKYNKEGYFIGAADYTSAPYKVDYAGNLIATSASITGAINATSGDISGTLTVSGLLIAGELTGYHATFGVFSGNAGLFMENNETYKGGVFFDTSNGTTIDSLENIYLTVASGKSLAFAVDSVLKASINSSGRITAVGGFASNTDVGYTGDLKDSSDTKIATVKGGIITAVNY